MTFDLIFDDYFRELQEIEPCDNADECTIVLDDGTEIARNCFEEVVTSNKTNFCGCSDFYGWTGQFCDESSVQLVIIRIFSTLRMAITLGLILRSLFLLVRLLQLKPAANNRVQKDNKRARDRLLKVIGFLLAALICSFLHTLVSIIGAYNDRNFELYDYRYFIGDDIRGVNQKAGIFVDLVGVMLIVFVISASLQISISWIELIEKFDNVFKVLNYTEKIKFYKNAVKYLTGFLIVFCAVFVGLGYLIPAFSGGATGAVFLLILFVIGRHSVVKQLSKSNLNTKKTIKVFNKSTRSHVIILGLICVNMIVFAAADGIFVDPGSVKPSSFAFNFLLLMFLLLIESDLWYVKQIYVNLKERSDKEKETEALRKKTGTGTSTFEATV